MKWNKARCTLGLGLILILCQAVSGVANCHTKNLIQNPQFAHAGADWQQEPASTIIQFDPSNTSPTNKTGYLAIINPIGTQSPTELSQQIVIPSPGDVTVVLNFWLRIQGNQNNNGPDSMVITLCRVEGGEPSSSCDVEFITLPYNSSQADQFREWTPGAAANILLPGTYNLRFNGTPKEGGAETEFLIGNAYLTCLPVP